MAGLKALLQTVAQHGNQWSLAVNSECEEIFTQQQKLEFSASHARQINVTKGLKYGTHVRHRLDVYSPGSASKERPVVVYFHGGGFVAGDNDVSDFLHSNIGHFFSLHSCVCILATYRLLPEARFPDGADDVASCLTWITDHVAEYGGLRSNIHVLGQSAGGAHLGMALFTSRLTHLVNNLKTCIFLSAPFSFDLSLDRRRQNMLKYYDTSNDAFIQDNTPVELFRKSNWRKESSEGNCKLVVMAGQFDSEEILDANFAFLRAFREKMQQMPLFETIEWHNHISYALAIGLEGEKLGPRILDIIT